MKTVIAGALGECVHVAGVINFLRLAQEAGWRTVFLGPAVSIRKFLEVAKKEKADLIGVSYRLTPETGERLLANFAEQVDELRDAGVRFAFGGTPPVAEKARKLGFFEKVFDGSETPDEVLIYLKDRHTPDRIQMSYPQNAIARIKWKAPYPILRHHFGLPNLQKTIQGVENIAQAKVLDVVSLGIDQDAQANFFHPELQDRRKLGAGGVPVRKPADYRMLYEASRCGNYPLMRSYAGTDDFLRLAKMYVQTINLAWCAVPIFWFNRMDGRGPWDLQGSIDQHQKLMQWCAERNIPVELNEPHHWGMRDAPDVLFVVSAYLSAYNAKTFGVKDYITQLMFNSPPGLSDAMDIAKMLAVLEIIEPLSSPSFHIWKQTRTGLLSYPMDINAARAHLATSIYIQMALEPHIVHIVGHTEAHHAATPTDVIEACHMAQRSITNALRGQPDFTISPEIQARKSELVSDAQYTLEYIRTVGGDVKDPFVDPQTLELVVTRGILDAPHLKNNPFARGEIISGIDDRGACVAINPETGKTLSESARLSILS
jgi:hypothetical protein